MAKVEKSRVALPTLQQIEPSKIFCNAIIEERVGPEIPLQGAGLWLVGRDMRVIWMNEMMEGIYGPLDEVRGQHCYEAFRGRSTPCEDCLPSKAFQTGNIVSGYISRTTKDDRQRHYQLVEAPLMDESNEVTRVLEVVLDVTEKRHMEDALQKSEREHRALFEHSGVAVVVSDQTGKLVKVNQAFLEISGYGKEEVEGKKNYLDFVHPRDRQRLREYTKTRFASGTSPAPDAYEFFLVDREGKERLIHICVNTLPNKHQIVSLMDITENWKLAQEVRNKEQFLANILRHSVEAIVALDPNSRIRSWNHGAELIFGYPAKEILGKQFRTLFSPSFRRSKKLSKATRDYEVQGFLRNYEAEAISQDGKPITIEITRTAIRDGDGKELGSSAIIRDITEARKLEQRMVQREKAIALGELAASLAHEIKNPLNSMVINLEVLKSHFSHLSEDKQTKVSHYVDVLGSEIKRLDKVIRGVLDFARPIEGGFKKLDITVVLQNVLELLRPQAAQAKIRLEPSFPKGTPMMEGAEDYLKQVFLNLFLNAFQAMPKGGKMGVSVKHNTKREILISISDTGVGIPRRDYNRIFDLHYSTKKDGSGLGLPLVQRLVKAHSGTIEFRSKVKHGTNFTITFPGI